MNQDERLKRINELAKKQKEGSLTSEEVAEQKALREAYIKDFRASLRGQLDSMVIQYPDGTRVNVKDMKNKKK